MCVDIRKGLYICREAVAYSQSPGARQIRSFINALGNWHVPIDVLSVKGPYEHQLKCGCFYGVNELPYRYPRFFFNRFFVNAVVPDIFRYTLNPFLYRKAEQLLRKNNYQFIITNSFPCSTHLVGLQLKKKYGVSWIAQFFDPWVGNIHRRIHSPGYIIKDEDLERQVADCADMIIHTNKDIVCDWINRYGINMKKKMAVIPLICDNCNIDYFPKQHGEIVHYYHIGNLTPNRNIDTLIKALQIIKREKPNLMDKLRFHFVGRVPNQQRDIVRGEGLDHIIQFYGVLPIESLPKYYKEADFFLLIDGDDSTNLFFPSKVLDYFAYRRPILGITPSRGATASMLKESGHHSFGHENIEGIADYLIRSTRFPQSFDAFDKDYINNFSSEAIIEKFYKLHLFQS